MTPAVADVARRGVHATIFAYGQTGTGKTHTMMGDIGEGGLGDRAGIIPRAAAALFETLGARLGEGLDDGVLVDGRGDGSGVGHSVGATVWAAPGAAQRANNRSGMRACLLRLRGGTGAVRRGGQLPKLAAIVYRCSLRKRAMQH